MSDRGTMDERTRILQSSENDVEDNTITTNKQESWSDLKPYIRPLLASNFISVVCGINDASIVSR